MAKPVCIDLFCGLGGWADGFLAAGFDVIGFDIERHDYGTGGYPGQLVLQDVQTLHGSRFAGAACIVASPPCQQYSYRAMPWKRAKALPPPDDTLFFECWRIREEASAAAGRRIPLIVENVKGAQPWVGRAKWHFGSYYLWGDVPALMPFAARAVRNGIKNAHTEGGTWFGVLHGRTYPGQPGNPVRNEGVKVHHHAHVPMPSGVGSTSWFYGNTKHELRATPSGSMTRKAASAQIAKIPFPLASWIARCFYPRAAEHEETSA